MDDDLDVDLWPTAPDTIPDDLLEGTESQDEITPSGEGDDAAPSPSGPSWHDKIRGRRSEPRPAKKIPPKPRAGVLVKPFTDMYTTVGTMLLPFDQPCGTVIINSAEDCARSLDSLARENPKVRRALMAMVETSVWGQVIAAHLPIITAIAMHHVGPVKNAMQGVPIVTMPQPRPNAAANGHGPYVG
jgi:hypothetical protein